MKATTLFVLLFLPIFGFSQAISSDKVIGTGQPAPYNSLANAVTYLNANGISGNIKFLLNNDETVSSQVSINQFPGSNNFTLTIKPNVGKTIKISGGQVWSTTALIRLNGADNIIIDGSNAANGTSKDLTLVNTVNAGYNNESVIWIGNGSDTNAALNNVVKNCIISGSTNQSNNTALNGIFMGGSALANESISNSNTKIVNNTFLMLRNAINVKGKTSGLNENLVITSNIFGETSKEITTTAILLENAKNFIVKNNSVNAILRTDNSFPIAGVSIKTGADLGVISKNIFTNISSTGAGRPRAIMVEVPNSDSNLTITNNAISNIVSNAGNTNDYDNANHGIFILAKKVKIYYNTVVISGNQGNKSAALLVKSGSAGLDVRNNILVNNQTSGTRYGILAEDNASFTSLDYNNYNAQNLSTAPLGLNSKSINPLFISGSSYKLQDVAGNNQLKTATPIAAVTTDIENVTRNTTSPTMGAYEISCSVPALAESFGNNEWNGYIFTYTENNTNFATATYIGTLKEDKIFDRDVAAASVNGRPNSLNIPSCITAPADRFMVRYKMKLTISADQAGIQNFTITGDDGYRLTVDGDLIINKWGDNSGTAANLKNLTAGDHELVLEYYEKAGNSKIEFSYGKIKTPANNSISLPFAINDTNLPFGINQWYAYGFSTQYAASNNFGLNPESYAGYYVQTAMAPNSELIWNEDNAPSTTLVPNTWNGAPTHRDNFTLSYKRQGFKCGRYTLKMDKWDDAVTVFINGEELVSWRKNDWSGAFSETEKVFATVTLNASSKIEIRLKDRGSKGSVRMSLTEAPVVYTGSNTSDISDNSMTIAENISINGQMNVCSCTVPDGKILTIKPGAVLNVTEDITVIGTGKIVVENTGSLVQVNNEATYIGSNSSFVFNRETTPITRFDFTYWSSPLKEESNFILGRELPGFTGTARKGLSPQTFLDKYYSYNGVSQSWTTINYGAQVMVPARGYIVRAPQAYSLTNAIAYPAVFEGKPNNGIITINVEGTTVGSNLIGNPYPSAINAQRFYDANSNLFDGTFYFWTHKAPIAQANDGTYQYSAANYISLNQTGSTANAPTAIGEGISGKKASVNIAAGQAFFVNTKANLPANAKFKFDNSMRVKEVNKNSDFFRMASEESTLENVAPATEKNRFWLNITNAAGSYNEALIGYVSGATDGYDNAFDGVTYASGTAIYTMLEDKKLVIQGKSLPFADTDVVPLGFSAATAGEYSIGLDSFDGLFSTQNVYLVDLTDNSYHNLKIARYTFTSAAGTFNSRFEIRYTNDTNLGVETPAVHENDIVVYNSGNQIGIKATNFTLDTVQVYDITGKLLFAGKNINSSEFTTSGINVGRQMVVVKITLDGNQSVSKKVMMK